MSIISLSLIGFGLAMDAFAVTIAKAITDCHMSKKDGLIMTMLFGLFQGIMPLLGYLLGIGFNDLICSFDHWIAFVLLGGIGLKMIYDSFKQESVYCVTDIKMMLILALATSIDAFAVGITFAFLEVDIILASILIALITFAVCVIGLFLGKRWGNYLKDKADLVGGGILIFMAFKILIEHLSV